MCVWCGKRSEFNLDSNKPVPDFGNMLKIFAWEGFKHSCGFRVCSRILSSCYRVHTYTLNCCYNSLECGLWQCRATLDILAITTAKREV